VVTSLLRCCGNTDGEDTNTLNSRLAFLLLLPVDAQAIPDCRARYLLPDALPAKMGISSTMI
jgi:hypothetical protein